jgi:hypothetical protein
LCSDLYLSFAYLLARINNLSYRHPYLCARLFINNLAILNLKGAPKKL